MALGPPMSKKARALAAFQHVTVKKRNFRDVEAVPVWNRKNEMVFYGEDYTDWDPALFQSRWDLLNETRKKQALAKC